MMSVQGTGPVTMTDGDVEGAGAGVRFAGRPPRSSHTTSPPATRMSSPSTHTSPRPDFFSVGMLGRDVRICLSFDGWVGSWRSLIDGEGGRMGGAVTAETASCLSSGSAPIASSDSTSLSRPEAISRVSSRRWISGGGGGVGSSPAIAFSSRACCCSRTTGNAEVGDEGVDIGLRRRGKAARRLELHRRQLARVERFGRCFLEDLFRDLAAGGRRFFFAREARARGAVDGRGRRHFRRRRLRRSPRCGHLRRGCGRGLSHCVPHRASRA